METETFTQEQQEEYIDLCCDLGFLLLAASNNNIKEASEVIKEFMGYIKDMPDFIQSIKGFKESGMMEKLMYVQKNSEEMGPIGVAAYLLGN